MAEVVAAIPRPSAWRVVTFTARSSPAGRERWPARRQAPRTRWCSTCAKKRISGSRSSHRATRSISGARRARESRRDGRRLLEYRFALRRKSARPRDASVHAPPTFFSSALPAGGTMLAATRPTRAPRRRARPTRRQADTSDLHGACIRDAAARDRAWRPGVRRGGRDGAQVVGEGVSAVVTVPDPTAHGEFQSLREPPAASARHA